MSLNAKFLTAPDGKKTDVVLPLEEYDSLIEDLHDLAVIAERRDEPTAPLDEVKERLKAFLRTN